MVETARQAVCALAGRRRVKLAQGGQDVTGNVGEPLGGMAGADVKRAVATVLGIVFGVIGLGVLVLGAGGVESMACEEQMCEIHDRLIGSGNQHEKQQNRGARPQRQNPTHDVGRIAQPFTNTPRRRRR